MKQKDTKKAIANKIQKWLQVIGQLNNGNFICAIPINRLRSIKSLIPNETTAEQFALYLSQKVQQNMNETERYEEFTSKEWSIHLSFVSDAIAFLVPFCFMRIYFKLFK